MYATAVDLEIEVSVSPYFNFDTARTTTGHSPNVIDLEHFIDSFRARRSNQEPNFWLPVDNELNVFDFCKTLMSILTLGSDTSQSGSIKSVFSGIRVNASVRSAVVDSMLNITDSFFLVMLF